MRILLAGTRGSAPITDPGFAGFGGDTTCLLVTGRDGDRIVLDCGSGLPALAPRLGEDVDLLLLLTHYHLDHLQGLGTFGPLHTPGARIVFAGAPQDGVSVGQAVRRLLAPPLWPLDIDNMQADIEFHDLAAESGAPLTRGGLRVRWTAVPHPGGGTAYRIDEPATGAAMVLATDVEWDGAPAAMRDRFLTLCREPRPADLLLHDGQYLAHEAERTRGWGHSTIEDAVQLARAAGVGRLLITHHDPALADDALVAREDALRRLWARAALARQGVEIVLGEETA